MYAYFAIVLLGLIVLLPWAIRGAMVLRDDALSVLLTLLLVFFGLGSCVFAARMMYLGLESYGAGIAAVAEVEGAEVEESEE